jgi:hypothetical protein
MSTESPYPIAQPTGDATITYSLREIIEQINRKLDLLPGIVTDVASMKSEANELKARVVIVESKVGHFEKAEDQASGASLFKDKFTAKLIGLASVMGIAAGLTVSIVQLLK